MIVTDHQSTKLVPLGEAALSSPGTRFTMRDGGEVGVVGAAFRLFRRIDRIPKRGREDNTGFGMVREDAPELIATVLEPPGFSRQFRSLNAKQMLG